MDYYRLLVRQANGRVEVSDIAKLKVDTETLTDMSWEKPVVRFWDGEILHLLALHEDYLTCIKDGIAIGEVLNVG